MLAKRIIPCLDCQDGRVVKGVNFLHLRDAGDPGELAAVYNQEGADELVVLDISASREARATLMDTVQRVARQLFIPLTVGGGVRTLEDGRRLLAAGADKVAINTAAVERPGLIQELAARFGSQAVVVAIDARRARDLNSQTGKTLSGSLTESRYPPATVGEQPGPAWTVVTYGGTRDTGLDAFRWARQVQELGAGEILLTSMDTDGTENGFDCDLTQAISRAVHIPVIASGGAGMPQHFAEVFLRGAADAALAASIFHFRQHTISSLKQYLEVQGVPVRKAESPCCGGAL